MSNTHFIERKNCPGCGVSDVYQIYSTPYSSEELQKYLYDFYSSQGKVDLSLVLDAEYALMECSNCKLIYQRFIPNDEFMEIIYESWIDPILAKENSFKHDQTYYAKNALEVMDVIQQFDKIPNEISFLDFGMGWGKWSLMAKAFGVNSIGLELSQMRIQEAQINGIEVIDWQQLTNTKFDYINTEQVFEHISFPLETLGHLVKSLNPNGLIKISVPNGKIATRNLKIMDWSAPKDTADSLNFVAPLEHINCFKTESILKMAEKYELTPDFGIRTDRNISLIKVIKNKLRPFYSLVYRPKNTDTCIYFRKTK